MPSNTATLAVEHDRAGQIRQHHARFGNRDLGVVEHDPAVEAAASRPVPSIRVLTLALPSKASALVNADSTRRSTRPLHRQVERRVVGGKPDRAAEHQRVLGDHPRHVGHRERALRELERATAAAVRRECRRT